MGCTQISPSSPLQHSSIDWMRSLVSEQVAVQKYYLWSKSEIVFLLLDSVNQTIEGVEAFAQLCRQ